MAEIAAATLRAVKAKKPQLVVLAGITGACDRSIAARRGGRAVSERIAGIPRYARECERLRDLLGLPLGAGVAGKPFRGDSLRGRQGGRNRTFRKQGMAPGTSATQFRPPRRRYSLPIYGRRQGGTRTEGPRSGTERAAEGKGSLPGRTHGRAKRAARNRNMEARPFCDRATSLGVACQIRAVSNYVERTLRPMGRRGWPSKPYAENINHKYSETMNKNWMLWAGLI